MSTFMKHLPWVAPTVAILAVGSGFLDRINISFDGASGQETAAATVEDAVQDTGVAQAAVAAVEPVATVPAEPAPQDAAAQLAALLEDSNANVEGVEVTRAQGFSLDTLEQATGDALTSAAQAAPEPVGTDFFAAAQANLAAEQQCVDDLRALAVQARVYFPSGGLTADQSGLEQARLLGVLAQQCPGVRIQVVGHSDPSGNPVANQTLSLERAQAVITRVAASGVDASLFEAVGRGDTQPSLVRGPEPQSYYDRRVEFSVIQTAQQASFTAPTFGASSGAFGAAACVGQLQAAVQNASIEYAPRALTVNDADMALAAELARIAASCPEARLRLVGQHSNNPRIAEDPSVGRLRAVILMTSLVQQGFPSDQLILGAPSDARPVAGLSDSRLDFQVILEDL